MKQGEEDGCRKAFDIENGDIQGAFGVFVAQKTVVDDPDDRGAHFIRSSFDLHSEFSRGPFHLHSLLIRV